MALFVHALNTNYVSQSGLGQMAGRMFAEGIIGEDDLLVSEKGTGTNMSVDVATGALIMHSGTGYGHTLYSTETYNVELAAADAVNPRKSLIVAVLDTDFTNAAVNDAEGGWDIIEVAGTAASTPAEPDSSAIQTAAGAGNLYQVLALVDVEANASEIVDADITDRRERTSLQVPASELSDDLAANFQYPTTETLTNATFMGEPVYVKTYTGTLSADARTTLDGSFPDTYKIISANGYRTTTGGSVFMNTIPDNVMSISLDSANGLTIQQPTTTYSGREYMVRVFYTKS